MGFWTKNWGLPQCVAHVTVIACSQQHHQQQPQTYEQKSQIITLIETLPWFPYSRIDGNGTRRGDSSQKCIWQRGAFWNLPFDELTFNAKKHLRANYNLCVEGIKGHIFIWSKSNFNFHFFLEKYLNSRCPKKGL